MDCAITLPASWYTSRGISALERRAVFQKSWILLGAVSKFPDHDVDYNHELAGVDFTVRRETEDWNSIKVYRDDDGSVMRYYLTPTGLLFLTLSEETCSFQEFFPGFEEKTAHADFSAIPLRRPLKYTSNNNWKAAVDAYQECLHCAYAHPEFAKIYKPSVYKVVDYHNYSQHIVGSPAQVQEEGLFFYMFPNCTLSMYAGGMTCWRINPSSEPSKSRMEFDYYHKAPVESQEFEDYYKFARNVAIEDIELCEKAQANYNVGIYSEGLLNPEKENGVAYFHGRVLAMCSEQLEEDQAMEAVAAQPPLKSAMSKAVKA